MAASSLQSIGVDLIDDHPDNPRLLIRDDVVDAISVNLKDAGEFPQKHAVHVRPVADRFQLLAGHHRLRAARKAEIPLVWAWVEEMDDETAFMELVLSNNQGELSPLEIGVHAFKAVPVAKGGRGKKGGLSEYAKRVGRKQNTLTEYRNAAEVVLNVSLKRYVFLDKAKHLAAIHKLPKAAWQEAVEHLAGKPSLAAKDVAELVAEVKEFLAKPALAVVSANHSCEYGKWLAGPLFCKATTPAEIQRIAKTADRVAEYLASVSPGLGDEWVKWLSQEKPVDIKVVQAKRIEFEERAAELEEREETDEIHVLLADPPWKYDFASTDNRQIENQYPTATADEISTHLDDWGPELADECVLFLWATAPKLQEALRVMDGWGFEYKTHAVWDKERVGMGYWFRGQHELLLVGTRGDFSPPEAANRVSSMFREKRDNKHSKKPVCVYEAIEAMFPDANKYEMYQRDVREGWFYGGNESGE